MTLQAHSWWAGLLGGKGHHSASVSKGICFGGRRERQNCLEGVREAAGVYVGRGGEGW